MFCSKCGKELQGGWSACPYCGEALAPLELKKSISNPENINSIYSNIETKRKHKFPLFLIILVPVAVIIMLFLCLLIFKEQDSGLSEQEILDKLSTFTTLYKEEDNDRYFFIDKEEQWAIGYVEVNEFVIFENDVVVECFKEAFGDNYFDEDSMTCDGFSYDIDKNEARIYVDVDTNDGHLSIVNYSFDDKEYVLNMDGGKYETTNEFDEFMKSHNLVENMQADIDAFKKVLKEHGLLLGDLLNVKYKTIDKQFVPSVQDKIENSKETTDKAVEKAKIIEVDYTYIYGGVMEYASSYMSQKTGNANWIEYTYYDMNNDGYLEFFIKYGASNADMVCEIYSTNGNVAMKLGNINGNCSLYENSNGIGIYADYSRMGYECINYVYAQNGKLIEEMVFEQNTDDYGRYNGKPIKELSVPLEMRLLSEYAGKRFYY